MKSILIKFRKFLSIIKKRTIHILQKAVKYKSIQENNIFDIENLSNTFVYANGFDDKCILVDVGCADDADLSVVMMDKFSLKCFGVDPTKKHASALNELERKSNGLFTHLPYALGCSNEELTFYESVSNQSGSLRDDHINVKQDEINTYKVQCLTIPDLLIRHGIKRVDYFKLDIEGAEYDLINNLTKDDIKDISQLFVEFHHVQIPKYTKQDTLNAVSQIESLGFKSFTLDEINYLFFN